MLLTLIRREIVGNVLSFRFAVTLVLFFSLILVSVFVMTTEQRGALESYEASRAAHRTALTRIEKTEGANQQADELFFTKGVYGDLRPPDLAVFVDGLERAMPSQVHMAQFNARKIDEDLYRNPLLALFASPDYGYIVNIVVSLLALLFVFDAICGEKERGTLKVTLANSVPRDTLILGKWIGGYLSLSLPFLAALAAGIAYVRLTGALLLEGETLERLAWIVGTSMLYISLFFTLGLMISTLTHRASTALVICLFVWICWILVIPNLAPVIARITNPVPSPEKIASEKLAVDRETDLRMQRVTQTTLSYGKEGQRLLEEIRQEGQRRKDKLDRYYDEEFHGQVEVSKTLSRLSPAASFRYATTELAGTGVSFFDSFKQGAKRFGEDFRKYADKVDEGRDNNGQLSPGWFQPDEVPGLKVIPPRVDDTLAAISVDLLLLGVYNLLFFMGAYLFFLRYDVT